MIQAESWFEVIRHKEYLYVIRERLDKLEPRFYTTYINLYLLLGNKKAILIDTGTGLFPLKPLVDNLIGDKKLMVVNTHGHFDHRGANEEFEEVIAHSLEVFDLSKPLNVAFLKESAQEIVKQYANNNFLIKSARNIKSIAEGDIIDLGAITLKAIHTPGHSPGSISLLSNRGEFFTGDTAHYGTMYLPKLKRFPLILSSLRKMLKICLDYGVSELYPSHEAFPAGTELLESLITGISNIGNHWDAKIKNKFLDAWILEDSNFKYIIE
jgi:glyoxylase-like metal-dependent hydrolase (beta-lactamase superfamily II)